MHDQYTCNRNGGATAARRYAKTDADFGDAIRNARAALLSAPLDSAIVHLEDARRLAAEVQNPQAHQLAKLAAALASSFETVQLVEMCLLDLFPDQRTNSPPAACQPALLSRHHEDVTLGTASTLTAPTKVGFVDDAPDLAPLGPRPIKLLQSNNPEVMRGHQAYVPGAEGGDFLVPRAGEMVLYKGANGIEAIFVGFEECFLEWPAIRGVGNGGPLDRHPAMPTDANWVLDPSTGSKVCLRANGNKVEKTIYGHALIDGEHATFVFRSTAVSDRTAGSPPTSPSPRQGDDRRRGDPRGWRQVARHLPARKQRSRKLVRAADRPNRQVRHAGWPYARGEARAAKALRIALKTGAEPPALEATRTPALAQIPRGSATFTTGKREIDRAGAPFTTSAIRRRSTPSTTTSLADRKRERVGCDDALPQRSEEDEPDCENR